MSDLREPIRKLRADLAEAKELSEELGQTELFIQERSDVFEAMVDCVDALEKISAMEPILDRVDPIEYVHRVDAIALKALTALGEALEK